MKRQNLSDVLLCEEGLYNLIIVGLNNQLETTQWASMRWYAAILE